MKRLLLAFALLWVLVSELKAQSAAPALPTAPLNDRRTEQYCEVRVTGKLFSPKITISVDFGQQQVEDYKNADGSTATFHSIIAALNHLNEQGWELVQTYVTGPDTDRRHFLMKRRLTK